MNYEPLPASGLFDFRNHKTTNMELLEQCAREKAGMGADWKPWAFECLPHHPQPTELVQVTGAVVPLKTRGKHAGRPDWNKKDKSTIRTVYITLKDHAEWVKEWERKTGLCANCEGSGEEWAGWSVAEGSKKRPCAKCGATGKSNDSSADTARK